MKFRLPNTRTYFKGRSAAGAKGESETTLNVGTPNSRNYKQGKDNALAYSGSETAYYQDYIDDGSIQSSESFAKVMKDHGKRNVQIVFPLPIQEDSIHENSADENNVVDKSNQEPDIQGASEVIGSCSSGWESAINRFESDQLELNQTDHAKSSPQPETNHSVELQKFDAQLKRLSDELKSKNAEVTNLKNIIRKKEIVFQGVEEEAIKLNRENDKLYKNLEMASVEKQLLNEERDKEHTVMDFLSLERDAAKAELLRLKEDLAASKQSLGQAGERLIAFDNLRRLIQPFYDEAGKDYKKSTTQALRTFDRKLGDQERNEWTVITTKSHSFINNMKSQVMYTIEKLYIVQNRVGNNNFTTVTDCYDRFDSQEVTTKIKELQDQCNEVKGEIEQFVRSQLMQQGMKGRALEDHLKNITSAALRVVELGEKMIPILDLESAIGSHEFTRRFDEEDGENCKQADRSSMKEFLGGVIKGLQKMNETFDHVREGK